MVGENDRLMIGKNHIVERHFGDLERGNNSFAYSNPGKLSTQKIPCSASTAPAAAMASLPRGVS